MVKVVGLNLFIIKIKVIIFGCRGDIISFGCKDIVLVVVWFW